jgi:hypothetical protein
MGNKYPNGKLFFRNINFLIIDMMKYAINDTQGFEEKTPI